MRRGSALFCYFAPKPLPTASSVLQEAVGRSHQIGVFSSRADALGVLQSLEKSAPAWWTDDCSNFVRSVENCRCGDALTAARADATAPPLPPVILVEGLDGVGKTTVTSALCEKLGAVLVRTPDPSLDQVRGRFRVTEEAVARAFYSAANYLAADVVAETVTRQNKPVVLDRWWASTAAMAIAAVQDESLVPPSMSPVYEWPADLPVYDLGVLLDVEEDIRLRRMAKRGDENMEEQKLAADRAARDRAKTAYMRLGPRPLERIMVPNYMIAVNSILARLNDMSTDTNGDASAEAKAASTTSSSLASASGRRIAVPEGLMSRSFSQEEVDACRPY